MQIKINNIAHSQINGPGNRLVIWVQGCPFRCDGCFNEETHSVNGGKLMSVSELIRLINGDMDIEGITFSGGEPLLYSDELYEVLKGIKKSLTRIIFTGCTLDEIQADVRKKRLITFADLTIAGRYDKTLIHPYMGKKFLLTTNRVSIDYFKPYIKVEYCVHSEHVTKTGIF